ncbi:hypothetical protein GCM10023196_107480 [Actinoallomurus vinaceus]|uniref:Uncharacterized protein n=1 Tax=Actinoallomurus vinaceus TaxID=1080074 RepID=A0ABP8UVA7_9ACTN
MMRDLDAVAANLMAGHPGWVVLPDQQYLMLVALPGHLRDAFWIYDTDPDRLAVRMAKVENYLRQEGTNAPARSMTRPPQHRNQGCGSPGDRSEPARPAAR